MLLQSFWSTLQPRQAKLEQKCHKKSCWANVCCSESPTGVGSAMLMLLFWHCISVQVLHRFIYQRGASQARVSQSKKRYTKVYLSKGIKAWLKKKRTRRSNTNKKLNRWTEDCTLLCIALTCLEPNGSATLFANRDTKVAWNVVSFGAAISAQERAHGMCSPTRRAFNVKIRLKNEFIQRRGGVWGKGVEIVKHWMAIYSIPIIYDDI